MGEHRTSFQIKNSGLIQEYIELKHLNSEIPTLTQRSQYLISELSILEVNLSEIEAKIHSKEKELQDLSQKYPQDIDTQIKILEAENAKFKNLSKTQNPETLKSEIAQNLQFKTIYENSYKEILQKFHNGLSGDCPNHSDPLETEKAKLAMHLKKQEILLQETVNDRNYIKNEVLPVLEHTLHLYEKNKLDLDSEIEALETKLKITSPKKPENIIYEEDEFELPSNLNFCENSPAVSPKQSLQYSFISANKFSARPASAKVALTSPRNRILTNQIKNKKLVKTAK